MASNKDTVGAMEKGRVGAMVVFMVTVGATAVLMAWAIVVVAIKGWAVERGRAERFAGRGGGA